MSTVKFVGKNKILKTDIDNIEDELIRNKIFIGENKISKTDIENIENKSVRNIILKSNIDSIENELIRNIIKSVSEMKEITLEIPKKDFFLLFYELISTIKNSSFDIEFDIEFKDIVIKLSNKNKFTTNEKEVGEYLISLNLDNQNKKYKLFQTKKIKELELGIHIVKTINRSMKYFSYSDKKVKKGLSEEDILNGDSFYDCNIPEDKEGYKLVEVSDDIWKYNKIVETFIEEEVPLKEIKINLNKLNNNRCHYLKWVITEDLSIRYFILFESQKDKVNKFYIKSHSTKEYSVVSKELAEVMLKELGCKNFLEIISYKKGNDYVKEILDGETKELISNIKEDNNIS